MRLFGRNKPVASKSYKIVEAKSITAFEGMPRVGWQAKWRSFTKDTAVEEGLLRSTWVYACIRLRAANIASVPWVVEVSRGGEWEPSEEHPLARLIAAPNPTYDWSEIMRRAVYMLDLCGDNYMSIIRANSDGMPRNVWPLVPRKMDVLADRLGVHWYKYHDKQGRPLQIRAQDLVHLRYTHPDDLFFGLAPLEASARAVDIDEEAERWQKVSLQNMAVPPGVITMEGDTISQEEYEQTKEWVREQSGADNARNPWVLANAKWQQMAQTAVDLDFISGRKMAREEILSAYSVPPPLVGIYEHATLANIETARQILWREGLVPVLDEIEGQLNLQLASQFGTDVRVRYDLSNVEALRENMTEKLDEAQRLWRLGVPLAAINERLELGLNTDEIPGADIGYVPSGVFPAGEDFSVEDSPGSRADAEDVFGIE